MTQLGGSTATGAGAQGGPQGGSQGGSSQGGSSQGGSPQGGSSQGASVVDQAKDTAQHLAGQAKEQVGQRAQSAFDQGKTRVADSLTAVVQALRQATKQLEGQGQAAFLGQYLNRGVGQVERLANYVRNADVHDVTQQVEGLARRQPAVFLGGVFAVGLVGARFLKSSQRNAPQHSSGATGAGRYPNYGGGYSGSSGSSSSSDYGSGYGSSAGAGYGGASYGSTGGTSTDGGSTGTSRGTASGGTATPGLTPSQAGSQGMGGSGGSGRGTV